MKFILLAALTVAAYSPALAQPGSGGPGPATNPTQIPLDGGASLLLAGGIGYALRKLRRRAK